MFFFEDHPRIRLISGTSTPRTPFQETPRKGLNPSVVEHICLTYISSESMAGTNRFKILGFSWWPIFIAESSVKITLIQGIILDMPSCR
jgi:hypothetical protein